MKVLKALRALVAAKLRRRLGVSSIKERMHLPTSSTVRSVHRLAAEISQSNGDGFVVDNMSAAVEAGSGLASLRRIDCRARIQSCFEVGVVAGHCEKIYCRMARR